MKTKFFLLGVILLISFFNSPANADTTYTVINDILYLNGEKLSSTEKIVNSKKIFDFTTATFAVVNLNNVDEVFFKDNKNDCWEKMAIESTTIKFWSEAEVGCIVEINSLTSNIEGRTFSGIGCIKCPQKKTEYFFTFYFSIK